jgi:uncharacterized Zn-binding protein involved in type VI secretion
MPAVALMSGSSVVACGDGIIGPPCHFDTQGAPDKWNWSVPLTSASVAGSSNVLVNGIGVVRKGDVMVAHPDGNPCVPAPVLHTPTLTTASSTVFVNGKAIGRVGDDYVMGVSHIITTGSSNVFAG